MRNNIADGRIIDNEESDDTLITNSDDTIITNSDVDIIDLDKLKTEVTALKMFTTHQLYLLKQSVGNPKTPEYNCNSKSDY